MRSSIPARTRGANKWRSDFVAVDYERQGRLIVIADIRDVLVLCRLLEVCPVGSVMMMMRWPERVGATAGFFERAKDRPG